MLGIRLAYDKNPKLLTKSFLRSFAILGGVGLVIHIAIYLTFPFIIFNWRGKSLMRAQECLRSI